MNTNASPDLAIYFGVWLPYSGLGIGGMKAVFLHDYMSICVGSLTVEFN